MPTIYPLAWKLCKLGQIGSNPCNELGNSFCPKGVILKICAIFYFRERTGTLSMSSSHKDLVSPVLGTWHHVLWADCQVLISYKQRAWTHMAKPECACQAWAANTHNETTCSLTDQCISSFLLDITTKMFCWNLNFNMPHTEFKNFLPSQSCCFPLNPVCQLLVWLTTSHPIQTLWSIFTLLSLPSFQQLHPHLPAHPEAIETVTVSRIHREMMMVRLS